MNMPQLNNDKKVKKMEKRNDEFFALDKWLHLVACLLLVCVVVIVLNGACGVALGASRAYAAAAVACIGVGKEVWDKAHGGAFDLKDLLADAVGILVGLLLTLGV